MPKVLGAADSLVLLADEENGVIVDKDFNLVVETGDSRKLFSSRKWETVSEELPASLVDLAAGALANLEIKVITASGRMYTIPKGVQAEAKKALEWRKEHKRGGTSVGLNTARTLAQGGQIGIQKVRHIAKYFPRHEIDKKAEGWEPGEKGFPSRGRIAWALWGGDSAWRWSKAIVERENKKSLTADGYAMPGYEPDFEEYRLATDYPADMDAFKEAMTLEPESGPEFLARVRLDGSGIDRLYKVEMSGQVYVWDDAGWDDLGTVNGDVYVYDAELDDPEDKVAKDHFIIDPESAIIISARMQQDPFSYVLVDDIDPEEAQLIAETINDVDWTVTDYAITAAGEDTGGGTGAGGSGTGDYTPEERAANARRQVRDANGRFAAQGSRVVIGGDTQNGVGYIRSINPDNQTVSVQLDSGNLVEVPANTTEKASNYIPSMVYDTTDTPPLDVSGILGEPRVPIDRPDAKIPGTLPAMTPDQMQQVLTNWPAWVKEQRDKFVPLSSPHSAPSAANTPGANITAKTSAPSTPGSTPNVTPQEASEKTPFDRAKVKISEDTQKLLKMTGYKITTDIYKEDPDMAKWLNKKVKNPKTGEITYPNRIWYQPVTRAPGVTSSGEVKSVELTPDTSDVTPLFMAVVSPDDPRAVLDLVSLVPAKSDSGAPMTFKRVDGAWVKDEGILADLNSATPPPVIPLDGDTYFDVLQQVDGVSVDNPEAVAAAGGLDRNRGNAERLRRYWTVGKGGVVKIRWNSPGDWTRCYRNLRKYMGVRAKGYCSLRHKEMTGMWPGDRDNRKFAVRQDGRAVFTNEIIASTEQVIEKASLNARRRDAIARMSLIAGAQVYGGSRFEIPLVIPEQLESGDGRKFKKGAIELRELPLPLMWQIKTADGHMGSVVVGRIDHMERTEEGIGNAYGVFDTGEFGQEAERLVREGFIRGVSADMDKFEAEEETTGADDNEGKVASSKLNITKARVMGVTIVPKPAFQECKIFIVENNNQEQEDSVIPDGVYMEDVDPAEAAALVACGFVAGAIPVVPPKDWFDNPKLEKATPLTVTDEGKVFGHIAAWHVDHIGMAFGTRPPRSKSKYAYFHTGVIRTDDGSDVPVGQLTLAGGHASLEASAVDAARHYDDTASAVADVHAGEDAFGIWVAGALRPGASPEQIRALRASAPSGDWRPIKGNLELVAVCQVNVPGFPIARARVASGQVMALVAAGASTLAKLKSDPVAELAARIEKLEQLEKEDLTKKVSQLSARFAEVRQERRAELSAKVAELSARVKETDEFNDGFGYIPRIERMKLAKKGYALPDGSYPITSVDSLKDSIQAYGRGKKSKRAAIRRHIMKRARALGKPELIPDQWKSMSSDEVEFAINDLRARIPAVTASVEAVVEVTEAADFADISDKARQRLAKEGKALPDGSYPIRNVNDLKNAVKAYGRANPEDRAKVRTHIRKRARALGKEELIPENWKAASTQEADSLGKASAAEFGKVETVGEGKYLPGRTQPRDVKGKFRTVLARIKQDLGDAGLQNVVDKVEETENLDNAGNYIEAARSAADLIGIIDRIDAKALNPEALVNVRASSKQLGETVANLPLPFGVDAAKVRFSDLPPALKDLVEDMLSRVEDKIGKEDADVATDKVRKYMAGGDVLNQSEISSELSKMLRLLT